MPGFDGDGSLDTRSATLLEQENARLAAALRRARRCLDVAFDPDADERALREALHDARRALTNESVRESSAGP
jgi:hypothetical protein